MGKQVAFILFLLLFMLDGVMPVAAHGDVGTLQIADEPVGQFLLNVWTTPEVMRPGEMLVASLITADNGAPILNCKVTYFLRALGSEVRQERPATLATAVTAFSYEATFQIPDPGAYLIEVEIVAPDGSRTVTAFDVEITAVSRTTRLAIHTAVVATLVLCFWFIREACKFWLPRFVRSNYLNRNKRCVFSGPMAEEISLLRGSSFRQPPTRSWRRPLPQTVMATAVPPTRHFDDRPSLNPHWDRCREEKSPSHGPFYQRFLPSLLRNLTKE